MTKPTRTLRQNRAMHLWLGQVADQLNAAGMDVRATLKPTVEIPWDSHMAKQMLWKPLQLIIIDEESTASAKTDQYKLVYDTLCRHFAQKHGMELPAWPSFDWERYGK